MHAVAGGWNPNPPPKQKNRSQQNQAKNRGFFSDGVLIIHQRYT
jgi:hypothetical protein